MMTLATAATHINLVIVKAQRKRALTFLVNTGHVTTPGGWVEVSGQKPFSFLKSTLLALPAVPLSPKEGLPIVLQGPSMWLNCILRLSTRRLPGWSKLFYGRHITSKSLASFWLMSPIASCSREPSSMGVREGPITIPWG